MENTMINQNQLRYFGTTVGTTVQDNHFLESPLYIMTKDEDFSLPLNVDGTNIFDEKVLQHPESSMNALIL